MQRRFILATFLALMPISGTFAQETKVFARDNLVAWCIVPFDSKKRGPKDRAAMLKRLGFKHFAYDYRAEHVPTFDAEMKALKANGIELTAFWFPASLNKEARTILDVLKRHDMKTQLWITLNDPSPNDKEQAAKVAAAGRVLRPIADEAAKIGCSVALYNHGGWFGEPENQLAIIEHLKLKNVGIVYNLHHGHDHLDRFPDLLKKMKPHLWALNLNGMVKDGDKLGKKILPLGQGDRDLDLLKTISASGYRGPIGILGHTQDDAEKRLRDNLDGLDWLVPQLAGKPPGPKPTPRTYKTPSKSSSTLPPQPDAVLAKKLASEAKAFGDARHGALVFQNPKFACVSCHKVGKTGGVIGPELTKVGLCLQPEQIVEEVLWPKHKVKDDYKVVGIVTRDGKTHQGYKEREDDKEIVLRDPATLKSLRLAKDDIEERREHASLMPEGLAESMSAQERRDLFRFLMELGKTDGLADIHSHAVASFPIERAPLQTKNWPNWQHPINRDRLYDFYAREADYFLKLSSKPALVPQFPGMDGGKLGHWGNQNEKTWIDDRWNNAQLGSVMCGVFHGNGVTVPRGVCVNLGDAAICFDPDTLNVAALWQTPTRGNFVKFSDVRHGFLHGLTMNGKPLPLAATGERKPGSFVYHGFYRHGTRVLFSYTVNGVRMLDAPSFESDKFVRIVAPAAEHPIANLTRGGEPQWPNVLETRGALGTGSPYAVDTIAPPFENPWQALLFFGDHDFLPDGTAILCTMQGDVWRVEGLDDKLDRVRWRRIASGLHQALGLVVADRQIYVLGRDQITRLHDTNGDGEIDFYECFSNAYQTSTGGHDYICGLQRDRDGRFYTASSKQGLIRVSADGKLAEVLATGFRNPDGLGLAADGAVTVPSSEGEWVPASMIGLVKPGQAMPYFGYGGPKNGAPPDLPLVYLPRGLDNSSGGQVYVSSDRWGPFKDRMVHFSYGTGSHFLLLRDEVAGQPQGGVVPLPGEFHSGAHRGRFNPRDGQLYVTGMGGWGTYTIADGCFHRVRFVPTADKASPQLPIGFHVHENGIRIDFTQAIDAKIASDASKQFAHAWNYRYSAGYGSQEYSPRHRGTLGHDHWPISAAHVLDDVRSLFLELPDLQPVNQLHLRLRVNDGAPHDLFLTVHKLDAPFTKIPNYQAVARPIAAHPILADLLATAKAPPNPWRAALPKARSIAIHADKNLTYVERSIRVRPGEPIKLTFMNPDAVPHNWVLVKPGSLQRVGELSNRLIAEPDAALRQYVPNSDDVLAYTDVASPQGSFTIYFRAPAEKGRYPYLCTFPGHWMVMNGVLIVE